MESGGQTRVAAGQASASPYVFGHAPFSGIYRTRVEGSGRLAIPAPLKAPMVAGSEALAMVTGGSRVLLFTPKAFDLMVANRIANLPAGMVDPDIRSQFYEIAPRLSVDKQGRLVLPAEQRAAIGIDGEADVVVTGKIERLEVWTAERYDREQAPKHAAIDLLMQDYSGLPTLAEGEG